MCFLIDDLKIEPMSEKVHFRSGSPPLQGGESLCEFYLENSKKRERLRPLQASSLPENIQDGFPTIHTNLQKEAFHSTPGEENLLSKNFVSLFNRDLLSENSFTQTFLQSILSSVDSSDPVVANAWMETLLDVIDLLPKEIIKGEILTLAVNKGQLSQPISSRLLCCKILGKICIKFDPYGILKEVLPIVLSLCQDVDYEVRASMCRQLDIVAKGIGLEATKNSILPELVELANDEEIFVRLAGIETIIHMLPMLDNDTCKQTIVPLVQKCCENSLTSKDSTLPVVSHLLGQLCHGLVSNFTEEQKRWFLQFFKNLSQLGLSHKEKKELSPFNPMPDLLPEVDNKDRFRECRHACAFNFPAIVLFAGPENFENELYTTFKELCADPFQSVRQTMAGGFFEIARLLNSKAHLLHPELVSLLQDESLEVLRKLIQSLPESLKAVCAKLQCKLDEKEESDPESRLVKALMRCEEAVSVTSSWRLHANFLSSLSCLPLCISSETIFTTFVPLLFVKLHTARPIPCRIAAANSLLVFLRSTPNLERRKGIINELIRELCYGKSCHKRMLFMKVCELVIQKFSKSFFKNHFFKPLLTLSADPVPNIRLRLCSVLPMLKSVLKLPKDGSLLQELESCIKTLMAGEKDRDVSSAVSKAIQELDRIEVVTETISRRSCSFDFHLDMEDWEKENEEMQLLVVEFHCAWNKNKGPKAASILGNVLNKTGKIPVRKSGTLPKPSKNREIPSIVEDRGTIFSPSKSLRSIKQERRISSPGFSSDVQKYVSRSIQTSKNNSSPSTPASNPSKPQTPSTNTWPRQKRASNIPKQTVDRCPSPMPPPRPVPDQGKSVTKQLAPSPKVESPAPKESFAKLSKTQISRKSATAAEVKRRSKCVSSPSPDTMRKSATFTNLYAESKIPTSRPRSTLKNQLS